MTRPPLPAINTCSRRNSAEREECSMRPLKPAISALSLLLVSPLGGCGTPLPSTADQPTESGAPVASPPAAPSPTPRSTEPTTPPASTASPRSASETPTRSPARQASSACAGDDAVPERLSLIGDRGQAFAFAPLTGSGEVTVEGRVSGSAAWSTSKVLVVAAYLDAVADGDPDRISAENRRLITAALTRSDGNAVNAIRDQIPGRPGPAITSVLRSVGDKTTVAPDSYQGTMVWRIREQVRFMAALDAGRVVSPAASAYLLETMQPIKAHSWGLGRIGATAYKGGWLRQTTATRQMGIVNGYAVAIITKVGPAVVQTDGDAAHVEQMNRLARLLRKRLAYEKACS
jgi:hypothetical protein